MIRWALEMLVEKRPFIYFLTSWHIVKHSDGRVLVRCGSEEGADFQNLFLPIKEFEANGEPALIEMEKGNVSIEEVFKALRMAIVSGYHIFVDENIFSMEMLEYLIKNGYSDYTVAIQSVADINGYFGDNNVINSDWILLGRHNSLSDLQSFLSVYGKHELADESEIIHLGIGKFLIFKRYSLTPEHKLLMAIHRIQMQELLHDIAEKMAPDEDDFYNHMNAEFNNHLLTYCAENNIDPTCDNLLRLLNSQNGQSLYNLCQHIAESLDPIESSKRVEYVQLISARYVNFLKTELGTKEE